MGIGIGIQVIIAIIFVWLLVISILVYRMLAHYNRLTAGVTKNGLHDVLEGLMNSHGAAQSHFRSVDETLKLLTGDGVGHVQRIGISRFNPFSDTGGAQSFSLAILDGQNNGIVMTSLYARNGNRWYVKEIEAGKGKDAPLSNEEESAIKRAHKKQ